MNAAIHCPHCGFSLHKIRYRIELLRSVFNLGYIDVAASATIPVPNYWFFFDVQKANGRNGEDNSADSRDESEGGY